MKKINFIILISCFAKIAMGQNAAPAGNAKEVISKSVTVSPALLSFTLDRGGTASKTLTVTNTMDTTYQLTLQFMDWTRDTLGNHAYLPPSSAGQSCAKWVSFDKPFVELGPGQSATIVVTMKVPDTEEAISEMKWTMLVVQTVNEQTLPMKNVVFEARVNRVFGVGVHIYQTPPNITNKELKMLSFGQLPGQNTYRIACQNVGGVQLYGKFSLELSSNETGKKTVLEPKIAPLFPRQLRYMDFTLPADLPKGKYTAIALVDPGDDDVPVEAAQKEIIVK